jgi:hypothetical protein
VHLCDNLPQPLHIAQARSPKEQAAAEEPMVTAPISAEKQRD